MQRCQLARNPTSRNLCNLDSPFLCYSLLDGGCQNGIHRVCVGPPFHGAEFSIRGGCHGWMNLHQSYEIDGRHGIRHDWRKILSTTWKQKKKKICYLCFRFFFKFSTKKYTLVNQHWQMENCKPPFFSDRFVLLFQMGDVPASYRYRISLCSFTIGKNPTPGPPTN